MKRAKIEERKRFAADVAERYTAPYAGARRRAEPKSPAQDRRPTDRMVLLARASVARKLVAAGQLDAELALAFAVWPTREILEREQHVGYGTLTGRAFGRRGNT